MLKIILTGILVVLYSINIFGQGTSNDDIIYFNPLTDDITKRLPPLRVLVDSAAYNSPSAKYEELKADYYYYEQISAAREWLEYFTVNIDAVGGHWDYRDKDEFYKKTTGSTIRSLGVLPLPGCFI